MVDVSSFFIIYLPMPFARQRRIHLFKMPVTPRESLEDFLIRQLKISPQQMLIYLTPRMSRSNGLLANLKIRMTLVLHWVRHRPH